VEATRTLLWAAFDGDDPMTEADWDHATGGTHHLVELEGTIVAHAAVVERTLQTGGRPLRTGYVEAVATASAHRGRGLGREVMRSAGEEIRARFELGALGTGSHAFYERLGWRTWRGPTSVRTPAGEVRTPDEDGFILVLETPASPADLDLDRPISCDWRPGDAW
jgi:aminoglycoside 2'-N-acetyltransferase I